MKIIYYTIYRGLNWFGQSEESDSIRFNAFIIQYIFTLFYALGILGFLVGFFGKSIIIHSLPQSIIFILTILGLNAYWIFYKKKYIEIEKSQSRKWVKTKFKNIFITLIFMLISIGFMVLSMIYLRSHPKSKHTLKHSMNKTSPPWISMT